MSKALVLVTFSVLAVLCVKAAVLPGPCPVVTVKDGFDATQYVGKWYEIRKYFTFYEVGLNCSRTNYTLLSDGKLRINNSATAMGRDGKPVARFNLTGTAYAPNPAVPAKLKVVFDNEPNITAGDYWVVDTDYVNFGITFSCANIAGGLFHEVQSFVLSRVPTGFNGDVEAIIAKALKTHNVDASLYHPEVQQNCLNN
jgi:lipocalin